MATVKQIDANRRNAQRSTGPRTPEGKLASSQNALKSGIYAESEILFFENPEDLATLTAEHYDRFQPATAEARDLVDSLIRHAWMLRRLARTEAAVLNLNHAELAENCKGRSPEIRLAFRLAECYDRLDFIQRRINATERNYHRTLKALQSLEPPEEQTPEPAPKLASFPQIPLSDASASPGLKIEDSPEPLNLASFPQPPTEPNPATCDRINDQIGDLNDPHPQP